MLSPSGSDATVVCRRLVLAVTGVAASAVPHAVGGDVDRSRGSVSAPDENTVGPLVRPVRPFGIALVHVRPLLKRARMSNPVVTTSWCRGPCRCGFHTNGGMSECGRY
jgi:hypothetical protein